ncbi:sensor histidine kinase [Methylococcus capsulatus str. Bath]|jgi:two-component system OmpR family sensor kinase|uniref:histidine kinase n=2 Tax=Methylococcus capsulatus TaxID=414 RepID=Q606S7_METCA|nr:ATP-binding protein [Methylococcus capsulatus]AAU92065.1 sensor histidine kinase [Methylococcus capsulatus str. Bath]CAI8861108.1 two-component system, OmpR family, sensor histidine kinase QseC [Methylococcus capsulatus]
MNVSIKNRLLLWLSPALLLVGFAVTASTYFNVREEIDELFDKVLQAMAYSLQSLPATAVETSAPAYRIAQAADFDLIGQRWSRDGRLSYRSHPFEPLPADTPEGWSIMHWRGEPWRTFSLATPQGLVQVAQAIRERRETADEITLELSAPLLFLLPTVAMVAWFGVRRGLAPLQAIVDAVRRRAPDDVEPFPDQDAPQEIGALTLALNGLLVRLQDALAAQRRFTADAAHELRSPLTALSLQVQIAERADDPQKQALALQRLRQGIQRATHVLNQMLTLARFDPEAPPSPLVPTRLDELACSLVGELAPVAADKAIDLGIAVVEPTVIQGNEDELRVLLRNLIDNAVRYTPKGGRVDVSVNQENGAAVLAVCDDGPGISVEERHRVFDRFYRGRDQAEPGSGLGLAIVRRIADRHAADIRLSTGRHGRGLCVNVCFSGGRT